MSLNKILKRNPAVALVDELAHTNVPGSRNKKRYQDVLELLDAGINVIAALNVQHLDSLNDLVGRMTGVVVRETVPDSFLKQADQVVNLDLAVEDLQERLSAGKIYAPDKIPWALEHFFKEENLTHLRELALREVAESVERSSSRMRPWPSRPSEPPPTGSRVMACMSSTHRALPCCCAGVRVWPGASTPTGSWSTWKPPTRRPSASMRRRSATFSQHREGA